MRGGVRVNSAERGFTELKCHPDVVDGVRALSEMGVRLVTLTNGATSVPERLLRDAGIADRFDRMLSVQHAQAWKPHARAYGYALQECAVELAEAMLVAAHPVGHRRRAASRANRGLDQPRIKNVSELLPRP